MTRLKSRAKAWCARGLIRLCSTYLRNKYISAGKHFVWNKLCVPYLCWREDELTCRAATGARFVVRPSEFVENRICFFGVWEPNITALFYSLLRPGDVMVDVGANIGYFTMLAAQIVGPAGRVHAVEPSPSTRLRLEANLRLNSLSNVSVLPCAAWHEPGRARFYTDPHNRGGSSLRELHAEVQTDEVELVRLDDALPAAEAARIRLIKIDIEGAEYHALQGLARILETNKQLTVISEVEENKLAELNSSAAQLIAFLEQFGFHPYTVPNDYTAEFYFSPRIAENLVPLHDTPTAPCYVIFKRDEPSEPKLCTAPQRALSSR
jgi:FkbM family methyltransferase